MAQNLVIRIGKPGNKKTETTITIPVSTFQISEKLLPRKAREFLDTEGIVLSELSNLLPQQDLKEMLIDIETTDTKLSISLE